MNTYNNNNYNNNKTFIIVSWVLASKRLIGDAKIINFLP